MHPNRHDKDVIHDRNLFLSFLSDACNLRVGVTMVIEVGRMCMILDELLVHLAQLSACITQRLQEAHLTSL